MKTLTLFRLLALSTLATDTIIVVTVTRSRYALKTKQLLVRLSGTDTPELGKPFGTIANQALPAATFGKTATIKSSGTDHYGRTLGPIFIEDRAINTMMVRMGMA
jgi:endonuclease YncB( thermonuclease family)